MIALKKQEDIQIYQIEMTLKRKTNQSPFIAILMFALEQGEINSTSLKRNLFSSIPERACENLLVRLKAMGYLSKAPYDSSYSLTDFGKICAEDKSFWIGEKGVYNVYVLRNRIINQDIIKTERVEQRTENDKENSTSYTPDFISLYEGKRIFIDKSEALIEDIESKCFQLKSIIGVLEISSSEKETTLKILSNSQVLYSKELEFSEEFIQNEILSKSNLTGGEMKASRMSFSFSDKTVTINKSTTVEYDSEKKAIMIDFDRKNLSLIRNIKIAKPYFSDYSFDEIELKNILHLPHDQKTALEWYEELLISSIENYFLSDNSFISFADNIGVDLRKHYELVVPNRKVFLKRISNRTDTFYQRAKLETIDYLNY